MGEYHLHNNGKEGEQTLKLGTVDDWRYVRREEALRLRACDIGGDLRGGLEAAHELLWRFPFPWEDKEQAESEIAARSMFKTVCLGAEPLADAFRAVTHGHVVVCLANGTGPMAPGGAHNPERSGYQLNVWVPCPFRADFNLKTSVGGAKPNLTIYGERYDKDGNGRTIYRCGYCEAPFSLDAEETEALRASFVSGWQVDLGKRLKARLPDAPAAAAAPSA